MTLNNVRLFWLGDQYIMQAFYFHALCSKASDVYYLVWSALALPTLKTVQPRLRHGAVVLTDNTISGAEGYKDLLAYMRAPESGFQNQTLPFTNGFEMSVYLPQSTSD